MLEGDILWAAKNPGASGRSIPARTRRHGQRAAARRSDGLHAFARRAGRGLHPEFGEHHYGRVDLELRPGQKERALDTSRSAVARLLDWPIVHREDIDGIKVYVGDVGWVMVRASGTQICCGFIPKRRARRARNVSSTKSALWCRHCEQRMKRHFYQLDVFTDKPLAGNPLAVITDGDGLSTRLMQAIAREMNLAETVFVQKPTGNRALARLRIFTTRSELPLAPHPVIGTWFLLAQLGVVPAQEGSVHILQQTGAGILPVEIAFHDGRPVRVAMTQKQAEFRAARIDRGALAGALGLGVRDLDSSLPLEFVSTGIFNLLVPVRRRSALRKIEPNPPALRRVLRDSATMAYCFAAENKNTVFARGMLTWEIGEDAATGSAAGSLGAYLVHQGRLKLATPLEIHQGIEMQRPSRIRVEVLAQRGKLVPRVSGTAVTIMEGFLES